MADSSIPPRQKKPEIFATPTAGTNTELRRSEYKRSSDLKTPAPPVQCWSPLRYTARKLRQIFDLQNFRNIDRGCGVRKFRFFLARRAWETPKIPVLNFDFFEIFLRVCFVVIVFEKSSRFFEKLVADFFAVPLDSVADLRPTVHNGAQRCTVPGLRPAYATV